MALTQISTQGIKDGTIIGSDLATNVDLVDNQKLRLGASQDLQIYHDSSNSYIKDSGTGDLLIGGDANVSIINSAASEFKAKFITNGAVELYHNNEKKLNTTAGGVQVTGDFATTGSGGTITANENLKIPNDTGKLLLGASNDLQIYHDGSNSYIAESGTGDLIITSNTIRPRTDTFVVNNAANNQNMISAVNGSSVELFHNGNKKFETTSEGAKIINTIGSNVAATLEINATNGGQPTLLLKPSLSGTNRASRIDFLNQDSTSPKWTLLSDFNQNGTNDFRLVDAGQASGNSIVAHQNGNVELYFNNNKKFETTNTGVNMPSGTAVFGGVSGTAFAVEVNPISSLPYGLNVKEPSGASAGYPLLQVADNAGQYFFRVLSGGKAQANTIEPKTNNSFNLGSDSKRWSVVFAANAFNTSDKNLKNTVLDSDLGLSFVNKLRPVSYKWNQKQEENLDSKTHYGFIAQEIETALISENKTLDDFAGVYKPDNYKEDGTGDTMAISTNEILSPLVKAVQELSNKVKTLETEVASLKAS